MESPGNREQLRRFSKDGPGAGSVASLGPWGSMLDDDASQGSTNMALRAMPKPGIDITKFQSSAERNVWSRRNPVWKLNKVVKPRMAGPEDENQDWSVKYRPFSFASMLGTHHSEAVAAFESLLRREQLRHLIIAGPAGCGKTMLVEIFINEFFGPADDEEVGGAGGGGAAGKVLRLDGLSLTSSYLDMRPVFEPIAAGVNRKVEVRASRLVVIDRFTEAEPAVQANVYRFMEQLGPVAKFFLIADSPKRVHERVKTASVVVQVKSIPPSLALQVVFNVCHAERVGFDRDGLQAAYRACEGSVTRFIEIVHQVFVKFEFVSQANVLRHLCPRRKEEKPTIPVTAALLPLSRCDKCTLFPPCAHMSQDRLIELALQRRSELPRYRDALVCRPFAKTGACPLFNREGHCSLDHPKNIHILQYPMVRCKLCTLPYPCDVCKYAKMRAKAKAFLDSAKTRIAQLVKLMEDPYGFIPPLVLERLKGEAASELARLDDQTSVVTKSTAVEVAWYKARLTDNQAHHAKFLQLMRQYPIEPPEHDNESATAKGQQAAK